MEGSRCFTPPADCNNGELKLPILEYSHRFGCSVTGGYRYRGSSEPALDGIYFYGDFCSGTIWGATESVAGDWSSVPFLETGLSISSFGESESGELFVSSLDGEIFRIRSRLIFADGFDSGEASRWKTRGQRVSVVQPGLDGTPSALAVDVAGSAKSFVRTTAPDRERSLTLSFLLAANKVDLEGQEVDIVKLSGAGGVQAKLALEPRGKRYRIKVYARGADGLTVVGATAIPRSRSVSLGLEWKQASGSGATDGVARLVKEGRVRARNEELANSGACGSSEWIEWNGIGQFLPRRVLPAALTVAQLSVRGRSTV
jgi:hypothetical protein